MALGPVTIGDLKRDGALLEMLCGNCNRHLYEDPAKFPFRDSPGDRLPSVTRLIEEMVRCA